MASRGRARAAAAVGCGRLRNRHRRMVRTRREKPVGGSGRAGRALGWFALAATLGCALGWARSSWVREPRLSRPVVADVAGRVETVDYLAAKDTVRLMVAPGDPKLSPHIRISLDQKELPPGIAPGAEIRVKARIAPPPPPMALPGTYDFARDALVQGHRRRR